MEDIFIRKEREREREREMLTYFNIFLVIC